MPAFNNETFNEKVDALTVSLFSQPSTVAGTSPPVDNAFLLLDDTSFLLLDHTQFLLLG